MADWKIYSDSALTSAYTALTLSSTSGVFPCYLGSTTTGRKLVSTTSGGNLSLSIADSATGSGHAKTAVRLATTTGGIGSASWGAGLTIGTAVVGGAANAYEFYAQIRDVVQNGVLSEELSLALSSAKEQAV
ncbi:MAG: hypothetical protein LLG14_20245 [Nocardiaceae bacterium]|jgi:hypothetical protein|nr:hypothetical protein [Nocardiaceae bacterium]